MPVDSLHPDYQKNVERWHKCRVVVQGEEAVKAAGTRYLPSLSAMSDAEYNAYKMRANFFAGTSRTLEAMVGMVFKQPPQVTAPDSLKELVDHITRDRKSMEIFAKEVVGEVFTTARYGVLVDSEEGSDNPYMVGYCAEDIINWRTAMIDGRAQLDLVVLMECHHNPKDEFDTDPKQRIRVLKLDRSQEGNGAYTIDLYRKREDDAASSAAKTEWVLDKTIVPRIRGQVLKFIPFIFIGSQNLAPDVEKPPLLDIANVNLSHYRTSADLEHGRHFTALPTPWAAGFDARSALRIGAGTAWVAEDPNARCGYLEFTGQGLTALENALKEKQQQMAVLGARLLETDKAAAEAADTLRIRRAGETNIVSSVADTVGEGLAVALTWAAQWRGASGECDVDLNKEYLDLEITPEMFGKMMEAVQAGLMSWDTFFYNCKRGNLLPDGTDAETEKEKIELGNPGGVSLGGGIPTGTPPATVVPPVSGQGGGAV